MKRQEASTKRKVYTIYRQKYITVAKFKLVKQNLLIMYGCNDPTELQQLVLKVLVIVEIWVHVFSFEYPVYLLMHLLPVLCDQLKKISFLQFLGRIA